MRRIIQFQVITEQQSERRQDVVYALTEDGVLWRQTTADSAWRAIEPPGDGNPFKPEMTQERLLKRLERGDGFPEDNK